MMYRRWKRWLCSLLTGMALHAGANAATLRVAALNLEWFPGQRPMAEPDAMTAHLEATRAEIAALAPGLVIATEVCDEAALREALAAHPGLILHMISSFTDRADNPLPDRPMRDQQIAIASTLPAVAGWAEPWVSDIPEMRRGFAFAALENPRSGRLIMVYGVHLKSNRADTPEEEHLNYAIRNESVDQLIAHMARMDVQFADRGIDGWIVAGDYNTNHDGGFGDRVITTLEANGFWNSWVNTPPDQRPTWKGRGPFAPGTLDYIMTRGFGLPDARLVELPASVSDHNAVIADLTLPSSVDTDEAPPAR